MHAPARRRILCSVVLGIVAAVGNVAAAPVNDTSSERQAKPAPAPAPAVAAASAPAAAASAARAASAPAARPAMLSRRALAPLHADPAEQPQAAAPTRELIPVDPMDRLRERLATRLGARSTPPIGQEAVFRVTTRPAAEDAKAASRHVAAATRERVPADVHWSYEGAGAPEAWAKLKPEYALCAKGTRQSPIDIQGGIRVQLEPVAFDYKPGLARVVDNGHTVQVSVAPGSTIEVMGRRYELQQFHFHRPSEERVDGRGFEMVVHLVHRDAEGRLAVVAVLLERGGAQPVVQNVWNHLPLEKGDDAAVRATLDPTGLLPDDRAYYTYMGSLTTPPCSEGVLWMVMKKPVTVSAEQVAIFARLYPMNARPVQSASGRLIKQSE
jgi:carbonic anhydrase